MLYTKSDNVDHLLNLDHKGKTIINWTLSCNTVSERIEKNAPAMEDRIRAAKMCQKAGYTVRFRFSPIIPINNWQDENREMIEKLFTNVKPDLITMDVPGWMSAEQIRNSIDISLLDHEYRELVERMAEEGIARVENSPKQIFPHLARLRIYRFFLDQVWRLSDEIPVAICMETEEMWRSLSHELRMHRDDYVCCCGPMSVPGHPMLPV